MRVIRDISRGIFHEFPSAGPEVVTKSPLRSPFGSGSHHRRLQGCSPAPCSACGGLLVAMLALERRRYCTRLHHHGGELATAPALSQELRWQLHDFLDRRCHGLIALSSE